MARRTTTTFEELLRSTPTRWGESTEPIHVIWDDDTMHFDEARLVIDLPHAVARRLGRPAKARLSARIAGNRLVVERSGKRNRRRGARN